MSRASVVSTEMVTAPSNPSQNAKEGFELASGWHVQPAAPPPVSCSI